MASSVEPWRCADCGRDKRESWHDVHCTTVPVVTEQKCDLLRYPDLEVRNEGTIFLLTPRTDAGAEWIGENLAAEGAQWFGQALCVEHRYIRDIVAGAIEAGLRVV